MDKLKKIKRNNISLEQHLKIAPPRSSRDTIIAQNSIGTNNNPITIDGSTGAVNLYPSTINISGETGTITKVKVGLNGLTHSYSSDLDMLLVGPQGQKVMLMSDGGGNTSISNANLTFDDGVSSVVPELTTITSGTYKPTDYGSDGDIFASPAPAGPYGTSLSTFNGTNANGTWSLYVSDDYANADGGSLNGWSLDITTNNDAFVDLSVTPASTEEDSGNKLVYTFTRNITTTNPLTVKFQLGGSATLNTDYTQAGVTVSGSTGSITFAPGASTATLSITPIADAAAEPDETVNVTLDSGTGYYPTTTTTVTGRIKDDDTTQTLTLNNYSQGWFNSTGTHYSGNNNYLVGQYLDAFGIDGSTISRNYFVFDVPNNLTGNIISAQLKINTYDFIFPETSETYQLQAVTTPVSTLTSNNTGAINVYNDLGDGTVYGSRTFIKSEANSTAYIPLNSAFVNALFAAKGSKIALGGALTTLDNAVNNEIIFSLSGFSPGTDAQLVLNYLPPNKGVISISDVGALEGQTTSANFLVKLQNATTKQVTVKYTTTNDTALAGSDYTAQSGTLTFNPGEVSKLVSIPIIDNNLSEADEKFKIILSNPNVNGYLLDGEGVGTISDTQYFNTTATLSATVENLSLTGSTNINGTGNNNDNLITGNSGSNNLIGLNGNDTVTGGAGNDTLTGGLGDDSYLFPASGLLNTKQIVEAASAGTDTIDLKGLTSGTRLNLSLNTLQTVVSGQLKLQLSANNVIENATGSSGNDTLIGNTLANSIKGAAGGDQLFGNAGNDSLSGEAGNDLLTGGAGNDSFIYATGKVFAIADVGDDFIADFTSTDKLVLSKTTFSALASVVGNGFSQATDFIVVNDDDDVATSTAKIVYSINSGSLYYNANGSTAGLGSGAEFATIITEPILTAANFAIIA